MTTRDALISETIAALVRLAEDYEHPSGEGAMGPDEYVIDFLHDDEVRTILRAYESRRAAGKDAPLGDATPSVSRRIDNLRRIARDESVNNFARSICGEAAEYLQSVAELDSRVPVRGVGALVSKIGGTGNE